MRDFRILDGIPAEESEFNVKIILPIIPDQLVDKLVDHKMVAEINERNSRTERGRLEDTVGHRFCEL